MPMIKTVRPEMMAENRIPLDFNLKLPRVSEGVASNTPQVNGIKYSIRLKRIPTTTGISIAKVPSKAREKSVLLITSLSSDCFLLMYLRIVFNRSDCDLQI